MVLAAPPRQEKKKPVDERMVLENVRKTLAQMVPVVPRAAAATATPRVVTPRSPRTEPSRSWSSTVAELAAQMGVKPQEVIAVCLELGLMVNINRRLDKDMIAAVADEFGFDVEFVTEYGIEQMAENR